MNRLLHSAMHRLPGVPAHAERPPGHQGSAPQPSRNPEPEPEPSLNRRWNHSATRPPRFLPAWQRRVAALFHRER